MVADHVASIPGITVLDLRSSQHSSEIAQRDDERIVSVAHANLPVGVWRLGLVWALGREHHGRLCRSSKTLGQKSDDERVLGDAFRLGTAREERVHVAGQPDAELAARKRWIPRSRGCRQGPTLGSVRLDGHLEDGLELSQGVGTCGVWARQPVVGVENAGGGAASVTTRRPPTALQVAHPAAEARACGPLRRRRRPHVQRHRGRRASRSTGAGRHRVRRDPGAVR